MVGYFYDYIRNIIIFLLFTSFLQIIMPNDRYKNYIQLILGMVLIFIMVKPAKDLFKNFEKIDFSKSYEETFTAEYDEQKYVEIHNEMVYGLFEENIKAQIEKIIG
ncbi:MAG: stage III sporulation protein AF, partial [Eubacteriales bacterium]|nr:stage III sporulation protein AF [Eubacteriales bacterium]